MQTVLTEKAVPYRQDGQFGFTNDPTLFTAIEQYVIAAIADGWSIRPTYANGRVEREATLNRDGYVMLIINRSAANGAKPGSWLSESNIHIWGPDGLAIMPPPIYDFTAISRGVMRCQGCNRDDVATERVGFAGRSCKECLPKMRADYEYPGWNN